jgi:hypothetical protein
MNLRTLPFRQNRRNWRTIVGLVQAELRTGPDVLARRARPSSTGMAGPRGTTMRKALFLALAVSLVSLTAFAGDPPARVARLNYISGEVSIQPNGVNDWVQASINRPLTSSDRVWADKEARAELQMGSASLRLDNSTSLTLVNVSDNNVQMELDQGTASLHVSDLFDGEIYEVDTPNVSFIVRKKGDYRFDVDNAGDTTSVTVFKGEGDATGEGPAVRIKKEQRYTFSGGKSLRYAINNNPGLDGFDQWVFARASREDNSVSAQYVSRYAVGYSDLDYAGYWETAPTYGAIWYPRGVAVGWAPYRYGHWVWVGPWGWTWVDDASWGFTPYHYGRWVYYQSRWGWCPGPYHRYGRPVYAPALVAWVGGSSWGVGLSFGIGGGVGWFPLGWGEPYIPYYGHSRGYFQHVNVSNTYIKNITYVTNNYYGGHHGKSWDYAYGHQARAVTAVSNDAFRTSRPTRDAFVRVNENELKHAKFERNVPLRPTTNSVLGEHAGVHSAAPPATWARPRPERTSVAVADPSRPDRAAHRDPVANNGATPNWENGRPNRTVPRPSTTAEVERPRGIPNSDHVNRAAVSDLNTTPSRVPRPPRNEDGSVRYGRPSRDTSATANVTRTPAAEAPVARTPRTQDREDRPQSYARPTREVTTTAPEAARVPAAEAPAARVPRPQTDQVVRPERHQDPVGRDQAQPVARPTNTNQGAVTRDVRPQAPPAREVHPAPTAHQAEPARVAQPAPASKPAPERSPRVDRKVEKESVGPQGAVRYPRPYGNVREASYNSFATPGNSYARTTSDYTPRTYSSPINGMSATRPSSHSYGSAQPTYSQATRSMNYSQTSRASSYSAPARSMSYSQPRASSYSAPSHGSYSRSSSRGSSHSSGSTGSRGSSGGSSSHHGGSRR